MATVDKNFKVKHGLVVEGTTATVNGEDIITTGSTSDSLPEGSTNKYFTDDRAQDAVGSILENAVKTNIDITYNNVDNVLTITAENGVGDSTTDDLTEGTTNKYFTDERAQDAIGNNLDNGLTYDDATGKLGVKIGQYDNGAIGFDSSGYIKVRHDANPQETGTLTVQGSANQLAVNTNVIARKTYVDDSIDTHAQDTSTHGVTGDIVGTSDVQVLTNKTINDELYFTNPSTQANDGGIKINDVSEDLEITSYTANMHLTANQDVTITSNNGDIVLNPDGAAYITSVSAGNQIATNSYVDNAVAGLTWKQSVNLLWDDTSITLSGSTGTLALDGHPALTQEDSGYRILTINMGEDNGIWVYSDDGSNWSISRATDADAFGELIGAAVYVMEGTQYGSTSWVQSNHYLTNFTGQTWTQFSGSGSVTAGTGIAVNGLEVSIDRTSVDTWYDEAGAASSHSSLTTGVHGVTGDVVGTSDSQSLSNKTLMGQTYFQSAGGAGGTNNYIDVNNSTGKLRVRSGYALDLTASNDVTVESTGGNVVLSGDTGAYVGTATTGNEIATQGWTATHYVNVDDLPGQLGDYVPLTQKGQNDGVATLDGSGQVPLNQLGNVPANYVTSVGTNLSVTDGELNVDTTPTFTAVDINSVAKQVAAKVENIASTSVTLYSFKLGPYADAYTSAEYTISSFANKMSMPSMTAEREITKVLLTTDNSGNVAITEYGTVTLNDSVLNVSAEVVTVGTPGMGGYYQCNLIASSATSGVTVDHATVVGTLFK